MKKGTRCSVEPPCGTQGDVKNLRDHASRARCRALWPLFGPPGAAITSAVRQSGGRPKRRHASRFFQDGIDAVRVASINFATAAGSAPDVVERLHKSQVSPVMDDVRMGDWQDHACLAAAEFVVEHIPADQRTSGSPLFRCLSFHAVISSDDECDAQCIEFADIGIKHRENRVRLVPVGHIFVLNEISLERSTRSGLNSGMSFTPAANTNSERSPE